MDVLKVICLFLYIEITSTEYEADRKPVATNEDAVQMDLIPPGYLPDNVYRELAWYGILQIQPFFKSTKNLKIAKLIWEQTLGRPHVILDNVPEQMTVPKPISKKTLSEEGAKWTREQRSRQEMMMDVIRTGGNGLTIRTVKSLINITTMIVSGGMFYKCDEGHDPDYAAIHKGMKMGIKDKWEKSCTNGQEAKLLSPSMDPCIEGEVTPLEYSFHEGWAFCMGRGDREIAYKSDGLLDCGTKTKILLNDFLDLCAIDNNIVITYLYYGDEPRQDMIKNYTLCSTWDPCRISYLYRLETPTSQPAFPTTTSYPCETTRSCPGCADYVDINVQAKRRSYGDNV